MGFFEGEFGGVLGVGLGHFLSVLEVFWGCFMG